MLHNTNQFYKWISELETARTSESERKYQTYASILRGHLEASSHVEDRVRCGVHRACSCICASIRGAATSPLFFWRALHHAFSLVQHLPVPG